MRLGNFSALRRQSERLKVRLESMGRRQVYGTPMSCIRYFGLPTRCLGPRVVFVWCRVTRHVWPTLPTDDRVGSTIHGSGQQHVLYLLIAASCFFLFSSYQSCEKQMRLGLSRSPRVAGGCPIVRELIHVSYHSYLPVDDIVNTASEI